MFTRDAGREEQMRATGDFGNYWGEVVPFDLKKMMRHYRVTIAEIARAMDVPQSRVRERRELTSARRLLAADYEDGCRRVVEARLVRVAA